MGRKKIPGLVQRDGIWHIDKRIGGRRVCQSTGTAQLEEAERFLVRLMEENRKASVYGVRPIRTFEQSAARLTIRRTTLRSWLIVPARSPFCCRRSIHGCSMPA